MSHNFDKLEKYLRINENTSSDSESELGTSPEVKEAAISTIANVLPQKSLYEYKMTYIKYFMVIQ